MEVTPDLIYKGDVRARTEKEVPGPSPGGTEWRGGKDRTGSPTAKAHRTRTSRSK